MRASPEAAPARTPGPAAERRQLTIMFVDLVGSTALSARMDPEELGPVMNSYQDAVGSLVAEAGGFVARYVGDGVLVYFGYPDAKEDDPERAVRCGLRVAARIGALDAHPGEFRVRVGIATGSVVVGDIVGSGASMQVTALGHAPNIGARLQAEAEPGTVLIDGRTRELAGGLFEYESRGELSLKGLDRPVSAFAVTGERPGMSRFAALRPSRAGLVNRQEELGLLVSRWRSVQDGSGRVVLISGEPGIGKSRLVAAFMGQFAVDAPVLHLSCTPNGSGSPFLPLRQAMEQTARLRSSDTEGAAGRKIDDMLEGLALLPVHAAALRRVRHGTGPGGDELAEMTPRRLKTITLEAIDAYVSAATRRTAAVIVVEDLHWVDPTTAEWLRHRLERAEDSPFLILVTTRRENLPDWATHPLVTNVVLNRLHHRETAELIRRITGEVVVPSDTVREIIGRADGLPLFVEELTQAVVDEAHPAGDGAMPRRPTPVGDLPTSLESLLASRLDRAGAARDVAQIASVIGREVPFPLLHAVADQDPAALRQALDVLADHGLITRNGDGEDSVYLFRHVLIQEAAYRTLLGTRRRDLHRRIATALDRPGGAGGETDPERLAFHYGRAGEHDMAHSLYRKAALRARGRYALAERVQHLRQAVVHVQSLGPAAAGGPGLELEVLIELGVALIDHHGSGHADVRLTFERARDHCLASGDHAKLVMVLDALVLNHHFAKSESAQMLRYAAELDAVAAGSGGHPVAALWAARIRSSARLLRGELEPARTEIESVIGRYRALDHETTAVQTARDPRASTYGNLAVCLTAQGRVEEALAAAEAGMHHARRSRSVPSIMASLRRACLQAMMVQDTGRVLALADRLIGLNSEYETFTALREGTIAQGWALLRGTAGSEVLHGMMTSLDELENAQHFVYLPFLMAAVADGTWDLGEMGSARQLLHRASGIMRRTGEAWCEAELLRLEAKFCREDEGTSATLLESSLRLARSQGAAWWELRTAIDLAGLWARTGRAARARALLETAMARLVVPPGLPDIGQATALLAGLTGSGAGGTPPR